MWIYRMNDNRKIGILRCWLPILLALALFGCASEPKPVSSPPMPESGVMPALSYYQMLHRMSAAEIGRERMVLAALPMTPYGQLRMAMVLGHPRVQQDYGRALGLLDGVLKSADPAAQPLQLLARLLADNYQERQKMESQLEKHGQQLKESQRKAAELQEKIDGLADIERTLPQRPRAPRAMTPGVAR